MDNFIEMYGVVTKILGGNYTIKLTNNLIVEGYISGKMRKHNIRVYEKDIVKLAISPYDLDKGRVVYRLNPKRDLVPEEAHKLCKEFNIAIYTAAEQALQQQQQQNSGGKKWR